MPADRSPQISLIVPSGTYCKLFRLMGRGGCAGDRRATSGNRATQILGEGVAQRGLILLPPLVQSNASCLFRSTWFQKGLKVRRITVRTFGDYAFVMAATRFGTGQ